MRCSDGVSCLSAIYFTGTPVPKGSAICQLINAACSNSYQQSSPSTGIHSKACKTPCTCPTEGRCDHSPCYAQHWSMAAQAERGILVCACVRNKSARILLHSLLPLSKLPYFELERLGRIIMLGFGRIIMLGDECITCIQSAGELK